MGIQRNGARSFLNALQLCCKWSRMVGFRAAVLKILGATNGQTLLDLWEPLCNLVDVLVGLDDYFNQKDATDNDSDGEDSTNPTGLG